MQFIKLKFDINNSHRKLFNYNELISITKTKNQLTMNSLIKYRFSVIVTLILLIFVCFEVYNYNQTKSLSNRIDNLNKKFMYEVHGDTAIYKISKDELEKIITTDVEKQLNRITSEVFKWLSVVISSVLAILAFFGIRELNRSINEKINNTVKEKVNKDYEEIKDVQANFRENIDSTIKDVRHKVEIEQGSAMNALALKIDLDEALQNVSRDAQNYALRLNNFRQKLANLQMADDEVKKNLLEKVFLYIYQSGKDSDMNVLRDEYQEKFQFNYITWANIAIANMNLYELYNTEVNRKYAFEACEKALELLSGYGTAYAVKLIFYAIDIDRKSPLDKEEVLKVFREINLGSDQTPARETVNYLSKLTGRWLKYVDVLNAGFPNEMKTMYAAIKSPTPQ